MGSFLSSLFIDPVDLPEDGYGVFQLLFLAAVYSFVLYKASKLIAGGSELLLLVLNPGFVGGFLLPVLGAVPDGAIVLFSGLGDIKTAQAQLSVGVGTLAGSTIMLLTLPWAACIFLGRVDLTADGKAAAYGQRPKLTQGWSMTRTGVQTSPDVTWNSVIMIITAVSYLVVQAPAWGGASAGSVSKAALAGCILSLLLFLGYSVYQVLSARSQEMQASRQLMARKDALAKHVLHLATLLKLEEMAPTPAAAATPASGVGGAFPHGAAGGHDVELAGGLRQNTMLGLHNRSVSVSHQTLRGIFDRYDEDKNGVLSKPELKAIFKELGYKLRGEELDGVLLEIGGADRLVSFEEFETAVRRFVLDNKHGPGSARGSVAGSLASPTPSEGVLTARSAARPSIKVPAHLVAGTLQERAGQALLPVGEAVSVTDDGEDEEEEEEEEENEHADLTPGQIKLKAFGILALGVLAVTLFSDPMCDVLSEMGRRINNATGSTNAAFYISFVVTPLISNASEIISSVIFAGKKTQKSIVLTYSQLLGAASMNNTFCLAIFLALVYFRGLDWNFGAEVTAIIAVEAVICVVALFQVTPSWRAFIPIALYPLSLVLVALLEKAGMN